MTIGYSKANLLGQNIMKTRKARGLSQSALADGICSQSMISSIEKGVYIPNSILLIAICNKLEVPINQITNTSNDELFNNMQRSNQKIKDLFNHLKYRELIDYMQNSKLLDYLDTDEAIQQYYLYYGISIYHLTNNANSALRFLKMALTYTKIRGQKRFSPIELMLLSSINLIESTTTNHKECDQTAHKLKELILNRQITRKDPSLNLVFYQSALTLYHQQHYHDAIQIINQGLDWSTQNGFSFMLADLYFLLGKCYSQVDALRKSMEATNNAMTLAKILHQVIRTKF